MARVPLYDDVFPNLAGRVLPAAAAPVTQIPFIGPQYGGQMGNEMTLAGNPPAAAAAVGAVGPIPTIAELAAFLQLFNQDNNTLNFRIFFRNPRSLAPGPCLLGARARRGSGRVRMGQRINRLAPPFRGRGRNPNIARGRRGHAVFPWGAARGALAGYAPTYRYLIPAAQYAGVGAPGPVGVGPNAALGRGYRVNAFSPMAWNATIEYFQLQGVAQFGVIVGNNINNVRMPLTLRIRTSGQAWPAMCA